MNAVHAVEALTAALTESDCGSIIFMSSTAALETFAAPQAFNALKVALITYGAQLGQALSGQGIRVNCISPGAIEYPGGNWEMIKGVAPGAVRRHAGQGADAALASPKTWPRRLSLSPARHARI